MLYGVLTGFAILGWQFTFERILPVKSSYPGTHFTAKGSARLWVLRFLLGSFVEELWRAFCIVGLIKTGRSVTSALLITSFVFGIGHLNAGLRGARIGFTLGIIIRFVSLGVVYGVLFLWTSSILSPCTAHFLKNTLSMFSSRHASATARPFSF